MFARILRKIIVVLYKITTLGQETGPHVTRYYMYKHLDKYSKERSEELRVLSISHSEGLARLIGFNNNEIVDASYPEYNILDLQR